MIALCMGVMPAQNAAAAATKIPEKVRVYVYSSSNWWGWETITWESKDLDERVDHIKTSSKDVIAKVTSQNISSRDQKNEQSMGIAVRKEGTYKVTFDIVKDDQAVSSHTVTVYAYPAPVTVKLGNTNGNNGNILTGEKGKLQVSLKKGNTLQKIEYGTYKEKKNGKNISSEWVYQTVKNNSTVTYSKKPYLYKNVSNDGTTDRLSDYRTRLYSEMQIRVTYKDKYTKQIETYTPSYFKVLDK